MKFPVDFEQKAKLAGQPGKAGYPYQLSASDLMRNFRAAALDVDESTHTSGLNLAVEESTSGRLLKLAGSLSIFQDDNGQPSSPGATVSNPLPTPPTTGTYVLGSIDGIVQWIATEECA